MQRDCRPDFVDVCFTDIVFVEVGGCCIGAADFETFRAVVGVRAAHVVEEAGDEEKGLLGRGSPGGICASGEGEGVDVDAETVVEDCEWETVLDKVAGACAHGR